MELELKLNEELTPRLNFVVKQTVSILSINKQCGNRIENLVLAMLTEND